MKSLMTGVILVLGRVESLVNRVCVCVFMMCDAEKHQTLLQVCVCVALHQSTQLSITDLISRPIRFRQPRQRTNQTLQDLLEFIVDSGV